MRVKKSLKYPWNIIEAPEIKSESNKIKLICAQDPMQCN